MKRKSNAVVEARTLMPNKKTTALMQSNFSCGPGKRSSPGVQMPVKTQLDSRPHADCLRNQHIYPTYKIPSQTISFKRTFDSSVTDNHEKPYPRLRYCSFANARSNGFPRRNSNRYILRYILILVFIAMFTMGYPIDATSSYNDKLNTRRPLGMLMGTSPTASEFYNPKTGQLLLLPGVPIPPPDPPDDAMKIAIIDSGILSDHPQLRTLVIAEKSFVGPSPKDTIGHGTFVALQVIRVHADPDLQELAEFRNIYPKLISARVTTDSGEITVESVLAAIGWAIDNDARFVNLSLGFLGKSSDFRELCETIGSVWQKTPTPARNLRRTGTLSARSGPRNPPHRHH